MGRLFFLTATFFVLLQLGLKEPPKQEGCKAELVQNFQINKVGKKQRLAEIDAQIEELQAMKRGYESKALRHNDYAEYLQFENQFWLEMRRHVQLAEEYRQKADYVQSQIDLLEAEKKQLQK